MLEEQFGCEEFHLVVSEEATGDSNTADVVAGLMIHDHPDPIGAWRAKSGRYAKLKVAILAAEQLTGITPREFRARYGCDCRLKKKDGEGEELDGLTADGLTVKVDDLTINGPKE